MNALVVLDFEATCDDFAPPTPQEIIELPSVVLRLDPARIGAEHESFVRPVRHPALTPFCRSLTGITQAEVDAAPTFPDAFAAHQAWLRDQGLPLEGGDWAFLTCGDWDLKTMLPRQLETSELEAPPAYRRWINLKVAFREVTGRRGGGMPAMLRSLELELEGRHHRGIDDCRNLARIALALLDRGWRPTLA